MRLWPLAAPFVGVFVLTAARLIGLVGMAPVLGSRVVSWPMRLLLALILALTLAPWPTVAAPVFDWHEVPLLAAGELLLGVSLGLGVRLVLHGLGLAASLIDQQMGQTAGQMLDPLSEEEVTPTTALLTLTGTAVLLSAGPLSGDLRLVRAVLDSFTSLPPGTAVDLASPVALLNQLMLQSLWLGLRVALPVVLTVGLVHAGLAWISRRTSLPGITATLTPLRFGLSLLILALTVTDLGDHLAGTLTACFDALAHVDPSASEVASR